MRSFCARGRNSPPEILDRWACQRGVALDFSRLGKPTANAFFEAFKGKFRAECPNAHWFMGLGDVRRKREAWCRDYNEERPHSAIGNKRPIELINQSAAHGPPSPIHLGKRPAGRSKDLKASIHPSNRISLREQHQAGSCREAGPI